MDIPFYGTFTSTALPSSLFPGPASYTSFTHSFVITLPPSLPSSHPPSLSPSFLPSFLRTKGLTQGTGAGSHGEGAEAG